MKKILIIGLVFILSVGLIGCGDTPEMVLVEAGTTSSDNGSVTVEDDFYIGKYHVTQSEFEDLMGFNPSGFDGNPDHPVEVVTWFDAVKYANELSEAEGLDKYYNISDVEYKGEDTEIWEHPKSIDYAEVTENEGANGYRLATEDEHEYAARGGKNGNATIYAGSDDLDEVGWYRDNLDFNKFEEFLEEEPTEEEIWEFFSNNVMTKPVGEKEANELGLYDMSGNVWDWTNTPDGSRRVPRGGGWSNNAFSCEVSRSVSSTPSRANRNLGFRLARRP